MRRYLLGTATLAAFLFVVSCKPGVDSPSPSSGSADFSKYIAIGNSLTAGFADGGLYLEGQKVAYPNLLAAEMKRTGGGEFTSPFFDDAHANGSGYLKLTGFDQSGSPILENVTNNLAYRDAAEHLIKYTEPIQNLGVPGMRLDLAFLGVFSSLNNYFERLLPDAEVGTKTYFNYVTEKEHTFFSFWLGNNDALGYATGGGDVTLANAATTQLTSKTVFETRYNEFIDKLCEKDQKGIVATIPDVTAVPFFTTVTIEALLAGAKAAVPPAMAEQIQAIFIQDKTAKVTGMPVGVRPATSEDLVVLPFISAGLLGQPNTDGFLYGLDPRNPVEDKYILDKTEVVLVKDHVNSYNKSIKDAAERKGLALADVYTYLNEVKNGIIINGAEVNASFITGGAFSLDGIHLTPKGNALIGNLFIEAINAKYGAKLSSIDVSQYRGVKFP